MWLAGLFAAPRRARPYRDWIDAQDTRFEKAYPGSKVNITLLPTNNDQFSAKLQAAFTSGKVPDVMLIYSGGYTTPYIPSLLRAQPVHRRELGDVRLDLELGSVLRRSRLPGGNGPIYGVPIDFGSYGLFYNKAMLKHAGRPAPPTTFDDLLAACDTLKADDVIPIAYGDRDGYSTDNWVTCAYASYMDTGDVSKVNDGTCRTPTPSWCSRWSS